MSLKSWREEFYSVPAEKVKEKDALAHSIKKWTGLLKRNRKRHGVKADRESILDNVSSLMIASSSCVLCYLYIDRNSLRCTGCPLYESRGGVRCDCRTSQEKIPPYGEFVSLGDARPMLNALRKAEKFVQIQTSKK